MYVTHCWKTFAYFILCVCSFVSCGWGAEIIMRVKGGQSRELSLVPYGMVLKSAEHIAHSTVTIIANRVTRITVKSYFLYNIIINPYSVLIQLMYATIFFVDRHPASGIKNN